MKRLGIILIVALFLFSNIFAQTGEGTVSGVEGIYFGKVIEPDKYVLGVGDIVRIYIILETGDPISFNVTVSPTGSINLPMVRAIKVSGLTLTEATREISKQLLKLYPRSVISTDLVYTRKFKIYVLGEVQNAGTHLVSAISTLDDVIKLAGLKSSASLRNIQIRREDKVITVDYFRFLKYGDVNQNPYIEEGDLIYVPLMGKSVKVLGQVKNPGIYEIKDGEKLKDVLDMAGGLTAKADLLGGYIERQSDGKKQVISIDLFNLMYGKDNRENIVLKDGDSIVIPLKVDKVYVIGYVAKPQVFTIVSGESKSEVGGQPTLGESEIKEGAKISELIQKAGGVLPNGSRRRIQVIRDGQIIKEVDLFRVLVKGDAEEEKVKLVPGDIVYVPLVEKTVKILGEIKDPGIYEIKPGEKIKDIIDMAGGFTVRASLKDVTVERYITEKQQIIKLDLTKLYKDGDESVNISLEDGDIINIPIRSE
ncbi:SLBB domain-containing protein [Dictyoglomus sp.]|jgi:protein involved in polysaccharide export with SLBB domain|uniref:SLBB domain-containing protein n=3 Tax=Dictyoglomus sp. TaxID=28205 RepID=UPI003D147D87